MTSNKSNPLYTMDLLDRTLINLIKKPIEVVDLRPSKNIDLK